MKTAYLIRSGEAVGAINVSNKLRSWKSARRAIRAAKRLGFANAYAAKIQVASDAILK